MSAHEPWFAAAASITGLAVMLIGDGVLDALGLLVAMAPLAYGVVALFARRHWR